ncbi:MAG: hypothetical protein A2138_19395 [Deltaproteobacteria bacterium RBG_16_71_12]|nr:MAG: hypothetical protein A2138_19395 [Deltaproteobacteria bacterium RBG_16_71_12]
MCTPAEGEGEGEGEPEVTIIALPSHAPVGVSFDVEFAATAAVAGPCRALVDATVVGTTALPATRVAVTLQEPGSAVTVDLDCGNAADTAQLVAWDYGAVSADSPVAAGDGSALSIATTPAGTALSCDLELVALADDASVGVATVTTASASVTVPESADVVGDCYAMPSADRVGPGKALPALTVSATPLIRSVTADVMSGDGSARFDIVVDGATSCVLTAGSMSKPTDATASGFSAVVSPGDIGAGVNAFVIAHCSSADTPPLTAQDNGTETHDGSLVTSMDLDNNGSVAIVLGDIASSEFELLTNDVFAYVAGDLAVRCLGGSLPAAVDLSALRQVGGDVVVVDCDAPAMFVALPELREVGGAVTISGNGSLDAVRADSLVSVGGDLVIGGEQAQDANPVLDSVELAALDNVGGQLHVQNNASLPCANIEGFCDATCEGGKSVLDNQAPTCACP